MSTVERRPGRRFALLAVGLVVLVAALLLWKREATREWAELGKPAAAPVAHRLDGRRLEEVLDVHTGPDEPMVLPVVTAPVSGTVLDADGRPAPGALVWSGTKRTATDENGRYEMALPAGTHEVRARGQGTGTAAAEVVVPPGEAPALHLPAGNVLRGRTVDRDGKGLAGIRVKCWSEEGEYMEVLHRGRRFLVDGDDVLTDANGEFVLRGLDAGPHRVFPELLEHPALRSDPPDATGVKPGGDPLLFRVMGAARLRGTVVEAGTGDPIPCFSVAGAVFNAPDGVFLIEVGEAPEVEFAAPGHDPVRIPRAGEEERRVALAPSEDSGVLVLLVSGEGGEPVAGLLAMVFTPDFHSWVRSFPEAAREFRFGRMDAGQVSIFLQAEGWTPEQLTATVPKDGEARPEVKLRRCGSARVRILDGKGNVVHHPKSVVLKDAEGKGPGVRWVYTKPQGTLFTMTEIQWTGGPEGTEMSVAAADGRLVGLLPGSYRLEASDGTVTKGVDFAVAAGEEVEVTVRLVR